MEPIDRLIKTKELERLLSHYGHVMDAADWTRLAEVFAEHAVCDWTGFGLRVTESLADLQAYFSAIRHPTAHHVSNLIVDVHDDTHGRVHSKLLVVLDDGTTVSGDYVDDCELTEDGWRIVHRVASGRKRRNKKERA